MAEAFPLAPPPPGEPGEPQAEQEPGLFLGEGAQYKVYDVGESQVLKVPQTHEGSVASMKRWHKGTDEEIDAYATEVLALRDRGNAYVSQLIQDNPAASAFFGNPKFAEDGTVLQDKVTTLGDRLKTASASDGKKLMTGYVDSIVQSWKYGCYDWVFNLAGNTAVDANDKIVMMDFGEMGLDIGTMHKLISDKAWASSHDVTKKLSPSLRGFFLGTAQAKLTHQNLDKNWKNEVKQW